MKSVKNKYFRYTIETSVRNMYSHYLMTRFRSFVPGRQGVSEQDVVAWADDLQQLSEQGSYFFCLTSIYLPYINLGNNAFPCPRSGKLSARGDS